MRKIFKLILLILFIACINVKAANETAITNVKVNDESINCVNLKCNATVDSDKVTISFALIDPEATSSGFNSGDSFSIEGDTLVKKLNVTKKVEGLETPLSSEYTFTITKHHESDDVSLKKLTFNGKKVDLKKDIYTYKVNVTYKQKDIKIEGEVNNSLAKLEGLPIETEFDLEESTKSYDFKVTSESGKEQEYRILVTRDVRPDTSIKSIKLSSGSINIEKGVYEYSVNVPYDVNKLDLDITTNSEEAYYDINQDDKLVVGENIIEILVHNKDLEQLYTIKVNRLDNTQDAVVNLEELKIYNYDDLDFVVSSTNYDLYFDDVPTSLRITATPVNKDNEVKINGNYKLEDGSEITIKVINNEFGLSKEYVLKIHKNAIRSSSKKFLIIVGVVIFLIATIITTVLIILKKKKKKKIRRRIDVVKKNLEVRQKNNEAMKPKAPPVIDETIDDDDDIELI